MRSGGKNGEMIVFTLLVLALSPRGPAATLTVDDDAPADFSTIQAAINAAVNGDTIIVQPGAYTRSGNRQMDFAGKSLRVQCVDPNDPGVVAATIIDCRYVAPPASSGGDREPMPSVETCDDPVFRAFILDSGEGADAAIEGFTIINAGADGSGGAILCKGSSPTIRKCVFRNNSCSDQGGAIFVEDGAPRIEWCVFEQNSADKGGAIACSRGDDPVWIVNCIIRDNLAEVSGGGLYCARALVMSGCLIARNCAHGDPTALWNDPRYPSGGGGVFLEADGAILQNCTIVANMSAIGSAMLLGCRNDASRRACLYNCILWSNGNGAPNSISSSPCCEWCVRDICPILARVHCSCVQDSPGDSVSPYEYAEDDTCFHTDPLFIDPCNGDYRLRADSPCVDVGSSDLSISPTDLDLDGSPRVIGWDVTTEAKVDLGAYELNAVSQMVVVPSVREIEFQCWDAASLTDAQTLTIGRRGQGDLQFTVDHNCPWLRVDPTSGGTNTETSLRADASGMPCGIYEGELSIRAPSAANSPITVSVHLQVGRALRVPQVFANLQDAVDAAESGDMVLVADGVYTGDRNRNVICEDKRLWIRGENGPEHCILDCNYVDGAPYSTGISISSGAEAVVQGLTVKRAYYGIRARGGYAQIENCRVIACNEGYSGDKARVNMQECESSGNGAAVLGYRSEIRAYGCVFTQNNQGAHFRGCEVLLDGVRISHNSYNGIQFHNCDQACLLNCLIVGNGRPWNLSGRPLYFFATYPEIRNCVLLGNVDHRNTYSDQNPTGRARIINSILWDNSGLIENLLPLCDVAFSNVQGGWDGPGNIDVDPCFVKRGCWDLTSTPDDPLDDSWVDGDYHLKSRAGRWNSGSQAWVVDDVTSPCVDAGDPNDSVGDEPEPNGGRINMGAYGGTAEASKSYTEEVR